MVKFLQKEKLTTTGLSAFVNRLALERDASFSVQAASLEVVVVVSSGDVGFENSVCGQRKEERNKCPVTGFIW